MILLCFLLQTTVFHFLTLAGVVPNFLLIVTMSFGLMRGRKEGMLVGFFSGLLADIFFGSFLGPYAMLYMTLGYANGFFHRIYYVEDVLLPMIMIAINDLAFNFVVYIVSFLMRNRLDFSLYLKDVILPEMVYTILITLFLYKIFLHINLKLKEAVEES